MQRLKHLYDRNKLENYRPYIKQKEFHADGLKNRERMFMAGNQLGKTLAGGMETAMHSTGRYPDWWQGIRFNRPTRGWVSNVTSELTRDGPQRILIGPPEQEEEWGTGAIPGDCIMDANRATGISDGISTAVVKHVSGGNSYIGFKAYVQGRTKWQTETLDYVWFDEEPPLEIYTEGLTRTNAILGPVFLTITPLLGMSEVVRMFLSEEQLEKMK